MSEKQYVQMLAESLEKKVDILRQLQLLCQRQQEILEDGESTPEALEENIAAKEELIGRLSTLDDGFEQLYERVKDQLEANKADYKEQIAKMQDLIRDITDRSTSIQVMEQRNKELAQRRFSTIRSQVKELRQSSKVVSNYYQNMMKGNAYSPQFMDSKK